MNRARLRFKALGLCAMTLGVMAFTASAAQGEAAAKWMVNGANLVGDTLLPGVGVSQVENNDISLVTEILGSSVIYECTGAQAVGAKLELEGKVTNGFKIKYTGCETYLNLALSAGCVPKSAGQPNGTIETLPLKGLMELHSLEPVLKIEPKEGANYAVIKHEPATCVLPESIPVRGKFVLKDCKTEGDVELITHLVEEHSLSHLFVISETPEHFAIITGSTNVVLTGTHAGLKWSGLPG